MSHIANALDLELKHTKQTAAELARRSSVNEAQISRIKSGLQIWVGPEDLVSLANGLFPSQTENIKLAHARLLHARLMDECCGPGAKYISLALTEGLAIPSDKESPSQPILPPGLQENLDLIALHINHDRTVQDFVKTIANFCRTRTLPESRKNRVR